MRDWIVGNYVVQRKLGAGPFCETYLGENPTSKSQVIVKRVHPALVAIPKICVRLRAQAISPPKLEHDGIVPLDTILLDRDDVWVIAGRATGVPFEDTLSAPKDPAQVGPAFARLLEAFDHAHRHGWLHADLKSSNLWLDPTGEFRILDFATCRLFGYSPATRDLLGVDAYRSPEQIAGEEIDGQSDLYSLGRILQRMLGGVSGPLDAVIRTATASDPAQRYRNAAEFRDALLACLPASAHVRTPEVAPTAHSEPVEEPFVPMESHESFLEKIRKPLRSIFTRNGHSNGNGNGNGHPVNGHPPLVEETVVLAPPPEPPPAPVLPPPATPVPAPPIRSLRETLASELVDFEFGSNNGAATAAPKSRTVALLDETIEFEQRSPAPPTPPAAIPKEEPADYADLVDSGFDAFRGGDYRRARDIWKQAQSIDSTNRLLNYNLRVVERKLSGLSR